MEDEYKTYSLREGIGHFATYLDFIRVRKKFERSNILLKLLYAFRLKSAINECNKFLPEDFIEAFSKIDNKIGILKTKKTLRKILFSN